MAQHVLGVVLRLLHPVMPFVTAELWEQLGYGDAVALVTGEFPTAPGFATEDVRVSQIDWVIGFVSAIRSVRTESNVPASAIVPVWRGARITDVEGVVASMDVKLGANQGAVKRLARVELRDDKAYKTREPAVVDARRCLQLSYGGQLFMLEVADFIDMAAETARLQRERQKAEAQAKQAEAKLDNADFIARAREEIVQENRDRLAEARAEIARLDGALARIG